MTQLIIATRNAHKVGEIAAILGRQFTCLPMTRIGKVPDLVEHESTFGENATAKATQLATWLLSRREAKALTSSNNSLFVLADDSGLEVDELNGAPGVHSARFAALETGCAANSKDGDNNAKLLRLLRGVPSTKRSARFRCVLAVIPIDSSTGRKSRSSDRGIAGWQVRLFEGICEGHLTATARGARGFGYDPLFVPTGYRRTFGELDESVKSRISHRAKALAKLKRQLLKEARL